MDRFRQRLSPTKPKLVHIPEGYRVVCYLLSPDPGFSKAESGFWIANLGSHEDIEPGFEIVENILKEGPTSSVIWVLPKGLLGYWATDTFRIAELLRRFYRIQQLRIELGGAGNEMLSCWPSGPLDISELFEPHPQIQYLCVADAAVVADAGLHTKALTTQLNNIGIPAYLPDSENRIFSEIHTPGSIIVGVPGARINFSPADQTLHQLYLERDKIEKCSNASAKLIEIEKSELAYIGRVIRATTPIVRKFLSTGSNTSKPLLSDVISHLGRYQDQKAYTHFIEAFLRSKVGVKIIGGEESGDKFTSTSENPIEIDLTTSHDGRERILVCADPPVYAMRFGRKFNSIIAGEEILKVVVSIPECAGVYVNSAISETGVIIDRETAISLLRS